MAGFGDVVLWEGCGGPGLDKTTSRTSQVPSDYQELAFVSRKSFLTEP